MGHTNLRKKGLMLQTLIGLIIGAVLLFGSFKLAANVLQDRPDQQGELDKFHQELNAIAGEVDGAVQQPIIKLEEGNALIGLNPRQNESERNGRLGDGDLHIILNKAHKKSMFSMENRNGKESSWKYQEAVHFRRPDSCDKNDTCLCLCEDASVEAEELDETYLQGLEADTDGQLPPPYSHELWQKAFLGAKDRNAMIQCQRTTCEEVEDATFYTPLTAGDFNQRPESLDKPLFGALKFSKKLKHLPFLLYENGFIIPSVEDKDIPFPYGYNQFLPESFPVTVEKVADGQVAVCLNLECTTRIEADTNIDPEGEYTISDAEAKELCDKCDGEEEDLMREVCASYCEQVDEEYPSEDD